ncbi:hypothetical protein PHMEG_00019316 [Phytophthora megakarya]|uniref:Uncharacterized protein n=1 Tax=Phytophthora megakarya TaxID=4795 RepID=A0A225VRM1_9STRA|nr:hypothetical protein PHMEG_00019316 [Phytophthora megakarya]
MAKLSSIISRMYEDRAETIHACLRVRGSNCQECRQKQIPSRRDVPVNTYASTTHPYSRNGLKRFLIDHHAWTKRIDSTRGRVTCLGLYEVSDEDEDLTTDEGCLSGIKRVIGSVNGVEAVSAGYIDCTPAEVLIDFGAVASLISYRVLKRVGRADTPLRPCDNPLNGVTGNKIGMKGTIDLPLQPFVVVDRLHVDANLGTDALKAFRAVIDLDENTVTLKSIYEVFRLGSPRVEEAYSARMGSTIRLRPGGQTLVVTNVYGIGPEGTTILVEGISSLYSTVRVDRTLCTVKRGKPLVEVCNTSTEDVFVRRGKTVAMATLVPDSAFGVESNINQNTHGSLTKNYSASEGIDSVLSSATVEHEDSSVPILELDKVLKEELDVDYSGSTQSMEQQHLSKELLGGLTTCLWRRS